MPIRIFQVDAFCRDLFSGNPAAVCPLEDWLPDEVMQKIAAENNLAETAFFVREGVADGGGAHGGAERDGGAHGRGNRFHLRWFTPIVEVDLCGHATLASAHVLFEHLGFSYEKIVFSSRSGELMISREAGLLQLNFPPDTIRPVAITDAMRQWFSASPVEAYKGRSDYMLVFDGEPTIEGLQADLAAIEKAKEARGVIVTAKGDEVDFVSRFFAPQSGIAEDPVTGSAHTTLTPYWSARLGKKELDAIQLSARLGFLHCRDLGDRIAISGAAKTYMEGLLYVSTSSGNPTRILR